MSISVCRRQFVFSSTVAAIADEVFQSVTSTDSSVPFRVIDSPAAQSAPSLIVSHLKVKQSSHDTSSSAFSNTVSDLTIILVEISEDFQPTHEGYQVFCLLTGLIE